MIRPRESELVTSQKRNSFRSVLHEIIRMADEKDGDVSILYLTREKKYEKRRIYDLVNVLSAVGICTRAWVNSFHWNGLDNVRNALKEMGKELELRAFQDCILTNLQLPASAQLGIVVKNFLWIFLYFGRRSANIHCAASILASEYVSQKKVLRRLYLVTQVLEHTGVVRHLQTIGEYQICYDVSEIMLEVLQEMHANKEFPDESVWALLSSVNPEHLREIHRKRMFECPPNKRPIQRVDASDDGLGSIEDPKKEPVN